MCQRLIFKTGPEPSVASIYQLYCQEVMAD